MATQRIIITEVHNFGGFFGGDTVTFDATPWPNGDAATWTIDEKAFQNIDDRFLIAADLILEVALAGDRVDRAWVRAARKWDVIKPVIKSPAEAVGTPQIRAYHCVACGLWVLGEPAEQDGTLRCAFCEQPLQTP